MSPIALHRLPVTVAVSLGLVLVLLLGAGNALAKQGRITQVTATQQATMVKVSATLEGGFPSEVVEQIRRGVPKDLFYTVTLRRRHRRFFDEEVAATTEQFTLKYDTLDGWYHIRHIRSDGKVIEQDVPTYAEALTVISRVTDVPLQVPPNVMDGTVYAAVKAEMRAVKLPLYLDYVFFFIPLLEFETPWARSANMVFPR